MRTELATMIISLAFGTIALTGCGSPGDVPPAGTAGAEASDAATAGAAASKSGASNATATETDVAEANEMQQAAADEAQQAAAPDAPTLEGTQWLLVQLGDETVVPEGPQGEPSLLLDPEGLRASGTGGCNQFTGTYTLEPGAGALSFSPLAATRRMCPEGMDTEAAFLDALGQVGSYTLADSHLELYDAGGELVARFAPDV